MNKHKSYSKDLTRLILLINVGLVISSCSSFYKTNPFLFSFDYLENENIEGSYVNVHIDSSTEFYFEKVDAVKYKVKHTYLEHTVYQDIDSCYGYFHEGIMMLDNSFNIPRLKKYHGSIFWFISYEKLTFFVINDEIKYVHEILNRNNGKGIGFSFIRWTEDLRNQYKNDLWYKFIE